MKRNEERLLFSSSTFPFPLVQLSPSTIPKPPSYSKGLGETDAVIVMGMQIHSLPGPLSGENTAHVVSDTASLLSHNILKNSLTLFATLSNLVNKATLY